MKIMIRIILMLGLLSIVHADEESERIYEYHLRMLAYPHFLGDTTEKTLQIAKKNIDQGEKGDKQTFADGGYVLSYNLDYPKGIRISLFFDESNDTVWRVGKFLSLNNYSGGRKLSEFLSTKDVRELVSKSIENMNAVGNKSLGIFLSDDDWMFFRTISDVDSKGRVLVCDLRWDTQYTVFDFGIYYTYKTPQMVSDEYKKHSSDGELLTGRLRTLPHVEDAIKKAKASGAGQRI